MRTDTDLPRDLRVSARRVGASWLCLAIVLGGLSVLALSILSEFSANPGGRWTSLSHDRNRHMAEAHRVALKLRSGDPLGLVNEIRRMRLYPPLHGVLAGAALAVGDLKITAAVWPSLVGWWATGLLAFLCARRVAPSLANLAGLVAVGGLIASPDHRFYATDVMLESLGAGLSMLCLYCYVVARQNGWAANSVKALGAALTLLLFLKYNYWLLMVISLSAAWVAESWPVVRSEWTGFRERHSWHASARWFMRAPIVYVVVAALLAALAIGMTGGHTFHPFGVRIRVHTPNGALQLAYWAILVQVAIWWRREGRVRFASLPAAVRTLAGWHILPGAALFALPGRVGIFLHFVSPANTQSAAIPPWDTAVFLARAISDGYHAMPLAAVATACLALVGMAAAVGVGTRIALRPGGLAVAIFVAVSAALTLAHPNHQVRYVHSWVPAVWILSGGALSVLLQSVRHSRLALAGAIGAGTLVAAMVVNSQAVGLHRADARFGPSSLDLSNAYLSWLSELGEAPTVFIVANHDAKFFNEWTYMNRIGDRGGLKQLPCDMSSAALRDWALSHPGATLIEVELDEDSPLGEARCGAHEGALKDQSNLAVWREQRLSELRANVRIWRPR